MDESSILVTTNRIRLEYFMCAKSSHAASVIFGKET